MKKENYYKLFYVFSIILIIVCAIILVIDYINYNPLFTSAPFSVNILIRALEFILPSLILFIIGKIIKNKFKSKDDKNEK